MTARLHARFIRDELGETTYPGQAAQAPFTLVLPESRAERVSK